MSSEGPSSALSVRRALVFAITNQRGEIDEATNVHRPRRGDVAGSCAPIDGADVGGRRGDVSRDTAGGGHHDAGILRGPLFLLDIDRKKKSLSYHFRSNC